MSTTRPFAYNPPPNAVIAGTEQVGSLAIGVPTSGFTNNPQFWNGPDEELGYVIAKPISGNTQPTPLFSGAPSGQLTLSSTYIGNSMNLSNGNQTVHQFFGYVQSVLGQTLINGNDKVMFSVFCSLDAPATFPNGHYVGIGTTSMNYNGVTPDLYNSYPGNDNQSIGLNSGGEYWYNGTIQASGLPTWTSGDTIDVAVSVINSKIWIRVNGGNWNNSPTDNPATGTGGQTILGGLTSFYPVLCPSYEGTMTILNNATYGVPSGFTLLGTNITASVGFLGTKNMSNPLSEATFVELTNSSFNQNFSSATDASIWLTNNGFWNSYITPVLYLDAGNVASYPGTGTVWTDLVGGKQFNLINGPTYDSGNGGKINFYAPGGQYAECNTSLPTLSIWSVGVWNYYTGANVGSSPCIVTEVFPGTNGTINYALGTLNDDTPLLKSGFFTAGWNQTTIPYTLTANTWNYIVGTYDGNAVKLYVNNTLIATTNTTTSAISSNGGIRLMRRWDAAQFWDGYLSTVAIYDKALDSGQISSIFNSTKSRYGL
jgi:hypothetical protein